MGTGLAASIARITSLITYGLAASIVFQPYLGVAIDWATVSISHLIITHIEDSTRYILDLIIAVRDFPSISDTAIINQLILQLTPYLSNIN